MIRRSHIRLWSIAWLLLFALGVSGSPRQVEHMDSCAITAGEEQLISGAMSILERSGEPQLTVSIASPHSATRHTAFAALAGGSDACHFYTSIYDYRYSSPALRANTASGPPRYLAFRRLLI